MKDAKKRTNLYYYSNYAPDYLYVDAPGKLVQSNGGSGLEAVRLRCRLRTARFFIPAGWDTRSSSEEAGSGPITGSFASERKADSGAFGHGDKNHMGKLLSVVVSVYNEEAALREFYDETKAVLSGLSPAWEYELLFVNDGSADGSYGILKELAAVRMCGS